MSRLEGDPAGRTALVTGAGSGIGQAIAVALARAGARVGLIGRRPDALERTAARIAADDGEVFPVPCDVTRERQLEAAMAAVVAALGPIEILVNNAGIAHSGPLERVSDEDIDRLVAVNVRAPFVLAGKVAPAMQAARFGRIVNVASTAALRGYRFTALYAATKHALAGLTRSLSAELLPAGITVNAVCPGFTDTRIVRDAAALIAKKTGASEGNAREQLATQNPLGRLVSPEEVADAVLYLVGPGSACISGHCLVIDGGTQPV